MSELDLLDDLVAQDVAPVTSDSNSATEADSTDETQTDAADNGSEESPIETVAVIPDGCLGVTEFASHMTQHLMKAKLLSGEDLDGTEYIVPQDVYQTVKAKKDKIPHVIVKGETDKEGRAYVKRDEATAWWLSRRERLSTRGTGAGSRASQRSPEDLLALLSATQQKLLYAADREKMWSDKVEQYTKLVEKYKGFLTDAKVSDESVELAIQEGTNAYNTEKASKEAEKAAKAKKSDEEPANA